MTVTKNTFETPDSLNQVGTFHQTFHHPIENKPVIPSSKRAQLRINLLAEELKELEEAVKKNNIVEVADALCDLQYVLAGAILEFGLGSKFKALFDEVQRSNMSKACNSESEAQATVEHYMKKGTAAYFVQDREQFLVFRKEDNKTLKNINYLEADLKSILDV